LLEYPGNRWGIGYESSPIPHKYPGRDITQRKGLFPGLKGVKGLALWPRGRLVALQADDTGEFATVAVVAAHNRIRVNAVVSPTGYLRIAIRPFGSRDEVAGRGFADCDPIIGDHLQQPVTWQGEAEVGRPGQPVSLRFQMRQAKLFGVAFY
jgi:hypothetical protein